MKQLYFSKSLNIGCGTDIKDGWINLDSTHVPGVNIVHDIEKIPLPFVNESFDTILCQDILEHIDYIDVLKDIHRILTVGGVLTIRVPHFTSRNNFVDPTHKKMFSIGTFEYFVRGTHSYERRSYYFDFSFTKIRRKHIVFQRSSRLLFYNRIIEWLVNVNPRMQDFYETTGFSRLFPAENIIIELEK